MQWGTIYGEILIFSTKNGRFLGFKCTFEQKLKRKFTEHHGQNICRLFHFLAQILYTTSEIELGYYHQEKKLLHEFRTTFQENHWNAWIWLRIHSCWSRNQILKFFCEKFQKISCKTFYRKSYFAYICDFVSNLLSKNVSGSRLMFLTRSRHFDFNFFF